MPPVTKNIGQIATVFIGVTPPTNKKLLWFDNNTNQQIFKYWDINASAWVAFNRQFDNAPTSGSSNLLTSGSIYTALSTLGLTQFTKSAHGFVVGDILRYDAVSGFVKAQADTSANARMVGMVSAVIDVNTFSIVVSGFVTNLATALTAGATYYLSDTTPGGLSLNPGNIVKPCVQTLTVNSCIFVNAFGLDV